jgi:hypothetical protein
MKETFFAKTTVVWLTDKNTGVGEPAIAVSRCVGLISLSQQGQSVDINDDAVEEVISAMRLMLKEKPKD